MENLNNDYPLNFLGDNKEILLYRVIIVNMEGKDSIM